MSYVQPQMRIYQQFQAALAAGLTPLYSCVVGPQYGLHRFSVEAEQASLGAYDVNSATAYSYPDKTAGSVIEAAKVEVWAKDAALRYYSGTGFAIPSAGYNGLNRIRAAGLVLQTANGVTRSAAFGTRDVAIGDKVDVTWATGTPGHVATKVSGFVAEVLASVGAATAYAGNQANTTVIAPNITSSNITGTLIPSAAGTYDGLAAGHVNETYTATVITGGATGVAQVRVVSTSGTDDQAIVTLAFAGTNIGTRGVTLAFTSGTLVVGDYVVIAAQQDYTKPVPVSGGAYSGPANTQYVVRIVTGGVVDTDDIIYKVETSNGIDVQGETTVSAAGSAIIGNYGVTMTFVTATQYCGGDIWTINAVADTAGAVRTLLLADKLVGCASTDTLTVTLALVDTVVLPSAYVTPTTSTVTVGANAIISGTYLGAAQSFPMLTGDLYVEYRELLIANITSLGSLTDATEVEATLGPVTTDNPLAYGVYKALQNSAGVVVYYIGVGSDDLAGYSTALDIANTNRLIYSMAPCSKASDIKGLFKANVLATSTPEMNNWRIAWLNSSQDDVLGVYTSQSGSDIMATISDPSSGTNYVKVLVTGGQFVTAKVEAGDTLRYSYATTLGVTTYKEAVIDVVVSEDELTLLTSADQAYPTTIKIEVWRVETPAELATQIAAESNTLKERRVRNIWPDVLEDEAGEMVQGYYLCCALAGLRSGVAPHAPLTNVSVSGFANPVSRSIMFTTTQLNTIAAGGTWIVTSDLVGNVFTRHQLTTDMTDLNHQEDSLTTNCDSVSRVYRDGFADLVGRGNVSDEMVNLIRHRIATESAYIMALPYPDILGPQIQGFEVTLLERDPVIRDRIQCRIVPVWPMPLNTLDVYIIIS